jgi:hypothetical protein
MKKRNFSLIIILLFLLLIACNLDNDTITVKDGIYVLEQTGVESVLVPRVRIDKDNISFSYDLISSYLAVGHYKIAEDRLTMTTNDGKYKYVFKIDSDQLFFQENESSEVTLIDEKLGVKITNNSKFKLTGE